MIWPTRNDHEQNNLPFCETRRQHSSMYLTLLPVVCYSKLLRYWHWFPVCSTTRCMVGRREYRGSGTVLSICRLLVFPVKHIELFHSTSSTALGHVVLAITVFFFNYYYLRLEITVALHIFRFGTLVISIARYKLMLILINIDTRRQLTAF